MMKRTALLLLVAACGEPLATEPDAGVTATDFIPPPPDAGVPNVPLRCVYLYPTVHHAGGSITSAETWLGAREHIIDGSLTVTAPITVQGCSQIRVAAGSSIELRANGALQPPAGSTGPSGIVFEPLTTAWGRIRINGGAFKLNGASIIGGGLQAPAALTMESGQLLVQGLTIVNSTNLGLQITGGTLAGSTALTIYGSTKAPVQIPANMVGQLPMGGTYTGNAKDEVVVPTTDTVSTSQTWHNVGVPYHLQGTGRIDVKGSLGVAVLTLEAGTTLAFDLGGELDIDPSTGSQTAATGALRALGTSGMPVVFTSSGVDAQGLPRTKSQGDWQAIYFGGLINTNISDPSSTMLDQVRIEFAGGAGGGALGSCTTPWDNTAIHNAAVRFRGGPQPARAFITNSTIADSPTNGIDRSYKATSDAPDFTATNTFIDVPQCHQTHPAVGGVCGAPQCD